MVCNCTHTHTQRDKNSISNAMHEIKNEVSYTKNTFIYFSKKKTHTHT